MTSDRHLGSTAAETHVKFQNDLTDLDLYLDQEIGSWLKDKLQVHRFVPGQAITYPQMWRTSPASQIRVLWRKSQSGIWWINCWWNWRCWRSAGSHRGCTARCHFHSRHRRTPHNPSRNHSDTQGRRTGYRQPQAGTEKCTRCHDGMFIYIMMMVDMWNCLIIWQDFLEWQKPVGIIPGLCVCNKATMINYIPQNNVECNYLSIVLNTMGTSVGQHWFR